MQYSISESFFKLIEADAAFRAVFDRVKVQSAPDAPPTTVILAFYGRHVAERVGLGADMSPVMDVIEDLMMNGNREVKNAVATGFWEAILAEASAGRFDFKSIASHVGPASRAYCKAWDAFTGVRTEGLHNEN